jgi:succinate dehydrogenase / fumarate reductase iron-sulfur subunit
MQTVLEGARETPVGKTVTLRILRANPTQRLKQYFQTFEIPIEPGMTVLSALLRAKETVDHSLAIRFSCRMAACGSCGMKINGIPKLACSTQISELAEGTITVEPLDNNPLIRDLVTDFDNFFQKHESVKPFLIRRDLREQESSDSEYEQSPSELDDFLQFSSCIKCGLCNAACPTMKTDHLFTGPQALAQAYRYVADSRDEGIAERAEAVDHSHGVWRCHFPAACTFVCPKGVDPALAIQRLKRVVLFPSARRKKGSRLKSKKT